MCVEMASSVLLAGMTQAAFNAYLSSHPELETLVGKLEAGVDGDLLLSTIMAAKKPDATVQRAGP